MTLGSMAGPEKGDRVRVILLRPRVLPGSPCPGLVLRQPSWRVGPALVHGHRRLAVVPP